ncbi:MAG TPA: hypothetical protein VGE39_26190 [Prosthecobacter sp.]
MQFLPDQTLIQKSSKGVTAVFDWRVEGTHTVVFGPKNAERRVIFDKALSSYQAIETWNGNDTIRGERKQPSGLSTMTTPTSPPTSAGLTISLNPNLPLLETFSQLAPNATEWALAPLDESVPPNVRQNLVYLREDLLDEHKQKPKAVTDAYKAAHHLCSSMVSALDEREVARVHAGYRAAQADASQKVSTQALDARRNYMTSWPQYQRDESQRAALRQQQGAEADVKKERIKVEWAARTTTLRASLDALYAQFRAALRQ